MASLGDNGTKGSTIPRLVNGPHQKEPTKSTGAKELSKFMKPSSKSKPSTISSKKAPIKAATKVSNNRTTTGPVNNHSTSQKPESKESKKPSTTNTSAGLARRPVRGKTTPPTSVPPTKVNPTNSGEKNRKPQTTLTRIAAKVAVAKSKPTRQPAVPSRGKVSTSPVESRQALEKQLQNVKELYNIEKKKAEEVSETHRTAIQELETIGEQYSKAKNRVETLKIEVSSCREKLLTNGVDPVSKETIVSQCEVNQARTATQTGLHNIANILERRHREQELLLQAFKEH